MAASRPLADDAGFDAGGSAAVLTEAVSTPGGWGVRPRPATHAESIAQPAAATPTASAPTEPVATVPTALAPTEPVSPVPTAVEPRAAEDVTAEPTTPKRAPAKKKTPARKKSKRARPGEKAAALIVADAERGDLIAGADEAGRGCLAGPLVAAAVLLEPVRMIPLIEHDEGPKRDRRPPRVLNGLMRLDDSKKVPKHLREDLAAAVLEHAVAVAVVVRSPATLDRDGLHRSNLAMLGEALDRVDRPGALLLSDGFQVPVRGGKLRSEAVIGGDGRSAAIAAASIIAKTVRDQLMRGAAHERWPEHGFDEHVGYATSTHHQAIRTAGITAIHRRSFASLAYEGAPEAH